jgi:ABC-type lipoprotein release transport system permease subunit
MAALMTDLRIAYMNLVEHGRRTVLLGTAIAVVTCLFVLLTALSTGIRHTLIEAATTLTTGHLNVSGFFKVTSGQALVIVSDYKKVSEVVRQALPELDFMVERGRGFGKLVSDTGSLQAAIVGIDISAEKGFRSRMEILQGSLDQLAQPNGLLVFEQHAKKLDLRLGDTVTLSVQTDSGVANTLDCRVVAVARDIGLLSSFNVFIAQKSLRRLYQLRPDATSVLQIHVKPRFLAALTPLAERLRQALEAAGYRVMDPDPRAFWLKFETVAREDWTGQKLDVTTWEDEVSFLMWTIASLNALSVVLLVVLLIVITVGIMNTLWIAIRERTREIGTLRAIGMQRAIVARLFLLEAGLLGVFGVAVGVGLGALAISLLNAARIHVPRSVQLFLMRDTLRLDFELSVIVAAVALITCVTCLAALYPSLRAARLKPIDAMAHFD